jgi:hypothetical protein
MEVLAPERNFTPEGGIFCFKQLDQIFYAYLIHNKQESASNPNTHTTTPS